MELELELAAASLEELGQPEPMTEDWSREENQLAGLQEIPPNLHRLPDSRRSSHFPLRQQLEHSHQLHDIED